MNILRERFESKYIPEPNSGCWLWIASVNDCGYGRFGYKGKSRGAHRISWEIYKGEIPDDMNVCHKCDVTYCVNPNHLFLGTRKDNMQDKVKKNRAWTGIQYGEFNGASKLTIKEVNEIRYIYISGKKTQKEIGKMFNVTREAISSIITGKTWKYLNAS